MKAREREYPVAMIRRSVNGVVHDLRPPLLHMFLSEADGLLSASPAVFVASPAQETEDNVSLAERERDRKLTRRLRVAGGHVSKASLTLLGRTCNVEFTTDGWAGGRSYLRVAILIQGNCVPYFRDTVGAIWSR